MPLRHSAGSNSLQAAIHYSGRLRAQFPPHKNRLETFPLDQAGDYFVFGRGKDQLGNSSTNLADFSVFGIVSGAFRGFMVSDTYQYRVVKLNAGENISAGVFSKPKNGRSGVLANSRHSYTQWADPGVGYVGFRFNSGAGIQYGWVRVRILGDPTNAFRVVEYAYGDPGERVKAGQKSSAEQTPDEGSLGWLAAGAVGLLAWRKSRSRAAI